MINFKIDKVYEYLTDCFIIYKILVIEHCKITLSLIICNRQFRNFWTDKFRIKIGANFFLEFLVYNKLVTLF